MQVGPWWILVQVGGPQWAGSVSRWSCAAVTERNDEESESDDWQKNGICLATASRRPLWKSLHFFDGKRWLHTLERTSGECIWTSISVCKAWNAVAERVEVLSWRAIERQLDVGCYDRSNSLRVHANPWYAPQGRLIATLTVIRPHTYKLEPIQSTEFPPRRAFYWLLKSTVCKNEQERCRAAIVAIYCGVWNYLNAATQLLDSNRLAINDL